MQTLVWFLTPYEFSPTVLAACLVAVGLYLVGLRSPARHRPPVSMWRTAAYLIGIALVYAVLQTRLDYWSQHMFFIHRGQHLVLHHLGPFLVALAAPGAVLAAGVPQRLRARSWAPAWLTRPAVIAFRLIQQPAISAMLFVGLIYLWLIPSIHFYAMLNVPLYNVMNWSMAIDGFLFWFLMLDPRSPARSRALGYGLRIFVLSAVIFPQILIGAYIALSNDVIYSVYAVCGRLWPMLPLSDQHLGGLITWIPASMMSVVGVLVLLHRWIREDEARARVARAAGSGLPEHA